MENFGFLSWISSTCSWLSRHCEFVNGATAKVSIPSARVDGANLRIPLRSTSLWTLLLPGCNMSFGLDYKISSHDVGLNFRAARSATQVKKLTRIPSSLYTLGPSVDRSPLQKKSQPSEGVGSLPTPFRFWFFSYRTYSCRGSRLHWFQSGRVIA